MAEKSGAAPLRRWLVIFVVLGVALRVFRYALGLPVWGDEAFLGINILDRSYLGMLRPLEYIQIAPLGFLWAERAMYQTLGMSEYAMRLIPTLAGIAGLIIFAQWARAILSPLAAAIATGVLAVSDLAIRHTVELKPYSFDLLAAITLLYFATMFLNHRRNRWLVLLMVITPVALFMSLPSVFVAAGVAATLVLSIQQMPRGRRVLVVLYALELLTGFAVLTWGFLWAQFRGSGAAQQICWNFPPSNPLSFTLWFYQANSGNYFSYPLDCMSPAGGIVFALMTFASAVLTRRGKGKIALLAWSPIAMTLLAAILRKYPYGDSPRVGQHIVGSICLLSGVGTAAIVERLAKNERAMRAACATVFALLFAVGIAGTASPLIWPTSETRRDNMKRSFVLDALRRAPAGANVVVLNRGYQVAAITRWYIHAWRGRVVWGVRVPDLKELGEAPLSVFNPATTFPGLAGEISSQLGAPPVHLIQSFGDGEGSCEVFIYPDGGLFRGGAVASAGLKSSHFAAEVVDRVK